MSNPLEMQSLMRAAERETGLEDWGDESTSPGFRDALSILLKSTADEVLLSEHGRRAAQGRLHMLLCNRLRLVDDRKCRPEIAQQQITRPLIITGLPRSGSSFLLDVLSQDPDNRVVRSWEILRPSPPPEEATYDSDPRIAEAQQLLEEQGFTDPEVMAAHPFDARLPDECSFIFEHSFASSNLGSYFGGSQFSNWLRSQPVGPMNYACHRQFLQHLQSRFRRPRWVLKAPAHMYNIEALLDEYPDAMVVQTHRDLMKVLPSVASFGTALRKQFCEPATVDGLQMGKYIVAQLINGTRHVMKTRERLARPEQFHDVLYSQLRSQPIAVIQALYAHFGLPLSEAARQAMTDYVASEAKQKHGHGQHRYTMSDYGFTEAMIDEAFADYIARYGVPKETN